MIPRAYITAWRSQAPWLLNEQVEQDLVISRALVDIFSDDLLRDKLAFRGGTALYKLFLHPARYSEDIDLIQVNQESIGPVFDRLKEVLGYLGEPRRMQKNRNSTLVFRFDSEIPPIVTMKLKVEINCREHFSVFDFRRVPFKVQSSWYTGEARITTFTLEELLGSKMRALYQRSKGRDLFDLWYARSQTELNMAQIIQAFHRFIEASDTRVSRWDFETNLREKMQNPLFLGDTTALLHSHVHYNPQTAFSVVMDDFISRLGKI